MPQHMRQTPPPSWNDPDATQRIPVVRPAPQRPGWAPVPAGQTPERKRAIWQGFAGFVGLLLLVLVLASSILGDGSTGSSSSASGPIEVSVLGCVLDSSGVANEGCTARKIIMRACNVPDTDVRVDMTERSMTERTGVARYGTSGGKLTGSIATVVFSTPDSGAVVICQDGESGFPIEAGMWSKLNRAGVPSVLPNWLR